MVRACAYTYLSDGGSFGEEVGAAILLAPFPCARKLPLRRVAPPLSSKVAPPLYMLRVTTPHASRVTPPLYILRVAPSHSPAEVAPPLYILRVAPPLSLF